MTHTYRLTIYFYFKQPSAPPWISYPPTPHHSPCLQSVAFTFPGCRQKGARGGGLAALEQLTNMASPPKNMTPPNTGRVAKKGWKQQERNPYMGYISLLSGYTIHTPSGYYPYMENITESQIPMTSTDGQSIYGIIWKWDIYRPRWYCREGKSK